MSNTFLSHSILGNMNIFRASYILQHMMFIMCIPSIRTATFKYNPSTQSDPVIFELQGNASATNDGIQLSTNRADKPLNGSVGRALYYKPVRLWDSATGQVADFSTHLSFAINVANGNENLTGDGLAFFLAPIATTLPPFSGGARLGLFNESVMFNSSSNPTVAVEFDTYSNPTFDPYGHHVGIDINSIKSVITEEYFSFLNMETDAWIRYNSSSKNLSVYVSPAQVKNPSSSDTIFISYIVDLKNVLPEWVNVGLTASTGDNYETHQILFWEFNSTDLPSRPSGLSPSPSPSPSPSSSRFQDQCSDCLSDNNQHKERSITKLVIGLVVGIALLIVVVGMILFIWQKKHKRKTAENEISAAEETKIITENSPELSTDDEYEHKMGPRKYAYSVLVSATDDFTEDRKLGEGGFGSVYRGTLGDSNLDVAVKKISQGSKQGKKEFASEVTIIGKLVHRNIVQLLGWCQKRGELLLVYEFMPNGSLDMHLFGARSMLSWVLRYKIANDLASALLYLHEGWHQSVSVVHRDIKSSNIMLDSDFNAKLGDFGLARFADHHEGLKTTMPAGTYGYIAPECHHTGKSSKESDIYSYGVVALEIACGRKVLLPLEEDKKVHLVYWVWELYVSGRLLEAADPKLGMNFDKQQVERLMVVGLWCATYDYKIRPSIKHVTSILNMEAPLPDLTLKIPPTQNHGYSSASSSGATDSQGYQSRASGSTHNTSSSHSIEMAKHSSGSTLNTSSAVRPKMIV